MVGPALITKTLNCSELLGQQLLTHPQLPLTLLSSNPDASHVYQHQERLRGCYLGGSHRQGVGVKEAAIFPHREQVKGKWS